MRERARASARSWRRTSHRRYAGRAATTSRCSSRRGTISRSSTRVSATSTVPVAGDLLVVNSRRRCRRARGPPRRQPVQLWLSTPLARRRLGRRAADARPERASAAAGRCDARPPRRRPRRTRRALSPAASDSSVARFELGEPLEDYLRRHGQPIRYGYVPEPWPLDAYQTVFALEPGSAEMPSAGRPFTAELVTELVARGVLRRARRPCTRASPRRSAASRRSRSATACRPRQRGSSTPSTAGAGA